MSYTRLNPDFTGVQTLTTTNLSGGNIKYARYGRLVMLQFENMQVTSTGSKVVGTMPSGYRPSGYNPQPYVRDNAGDVAQAWVLTDGTINVNFQKTNTPYAGFGIWLIT